MAGCVILRLWRSCRTPRAPRAGCGSGAPRAAMPLPPSFPSLPPSLSALSPAAPARARPSPVRAAGGAAGGAPARPGPAPRRWNRAPGSLARRAGCTPDPPAAPAEPGPARFGHGAARGPTAGERRAGTSPGHRRGGGDGAGSAGTAHLATAESCQVFGTESAELKSPPFAT